MHRPAVSSALRASTGWGRMMRSSPVTIDHRGEELMTPVRRIAAAALVAVLGLGVAGVGMAPAADALDITWGKTKAPH